jgi:excisionase family DNA binding protein
MQPKPSYSTAYVAKRLGVSIPTIQRWVDAGHLKAWKTLGGHRRVDAESADRLFKLQAEGSLPQAAAPLAVVIVDDNPDDRDLLGAMVEAHVPGARIHSAENGFEGLLTIGLVEPDVVITDIVMPHMDGLEMIQQLLAHASLKTPRVIAMSSLSRAQVAERGPLPPDVRFIAKPIDEAEVAEALAAARAARPARSAEGS